MDTAQPSFESARVFEAPSNPRVLFGSMSLLAQIAFVTITSIALSVAVTWILLVLLPPPSARVFRISIAISTIVPLLVAAPSTWLIGSLLLKAESCRRLAERLATIDPLTGALNRRRFFALATALMASRAPANKSVAVLLLDIDHFKAINDQYGHAAGDAALQMVAVRCRDQLLPHDLFARLGGEEFVILLSEVTETEAIQAAERIRLGIEALSIQTADGEIFGATVSIGVGVPEEHATPFEVLLDVADKAMYVAKRQGRNRVSRGCRTTPGPPAHQDAGSGAQHLKLHGARSSTSIVRRVPPSGRRDSAREPEQPSGERIEHKSRTLKRFSDAVIRVGRARTTVGIAGASVLISIVIGLLTLAAWDAATGEWRLLMSLCVVVPFIVAPPIGWAAATVALEAHAAQSLAERQAKTDPLTELSNRRHFFEVAHREFSSAAEQHRPLVVFVLDLDHFKSVNDTYGHGTGDAVLARVAQVALGCLRPQDILARMGGEEFAALLPNTPLNLALPMAEAIRASVGAISMAEPSGATIRPTLSIGVADLASRDPSISAVLERADEAMYAAKRAGRNRVHARGEGVAHG